MFLLRFSRLLPSRLPRCARPLSQAAPLPPDGLDRWPHFSSTRGVLRSLDWAGTAVFAASGSIAAASSGMDLLGACVIGTVTAVGGGTLRDVLVLRKEPFWAGADGEHEYLFISAAAAVAAFFLFPIVGAAAWPNDDLPDAISLGAFAVIGAQNGVRALLPPQLSLLCGVLTATGGGMVRDIATRRPIRVLHSHKELYAVAAGSGAGAYLLARHLRAPLPVRVAVGVLITAAVRIAALEGGLRLPVWGPEPTLK